jgi:hypothetical protein
MATICPRVDDRGADLNDRPLAADRGARADGQGRSERFDHRYDWPDDAVLIVDRVHHLGHAVAARFRCKGGDQKGDDQSADDRNDDDECAPRAGRREFAGVVIDRERAEKGYVVKETDQRAEEDSAEPGDDPDDNRQERQSQQPESQGSPECHPIPAHGAFAAARQVGHRFCDDQTRKITFPSASDPV